MDEIDEPVGLEAIEVPHLADLCHLSGNVVKQQNALFAARKAVCPFEPPHCSGAPP
jgi:hypothetical protein